MPPLFLLARSISRHLSKHRTVNSKRNFKNNSGKFLFPLYKSVIKHLPICGNFMPRRVCKFELWLMILRQFLPKYVYNFLTLLLACGKHLENRNVNFFYLIGDWGLCKTICTYLLYISFFDVSSNESSDRDSLESQCLEIILNKIEKTVNKNYAG